MEERDRKTVEAHLDGVICDRCGATLATYYSRCDEPLDGGCPGFRTIEDAIARVKGRSAPRH